MTDEELLERLQATRPWGFTEYIGINMEQASEGFVRVSCQIEDRHLNPHKMAHGGVTFSMLDTASGIAGTTLCQEGQGIVTQCADIHFLRPVKPGTVYAESRILKAGRHTAFASAELRDESGNVCVRGEFEMFFVSKEPHN